MHWTRTPLSQKRTKRQDTTAYLLSNVLPPLLAVQSISLWSRWVYYQSKLLLNMNKCGKV